MYIIFLAHKNSKTNIESSKTPKKKQNWFTLQNFELLNVYV